MFSPSNGVYQLEPNVIPDDKLGLPIGFEIDAGNGFVVPDSNPKIRAYKLPRINDIVVDVDVLGWVDEGLMVVLNYAASSTDKATFVNKPKIHLVT